MAGDLIEVLASTALFRDLEPSELRRIAEIGRVERWPQGAVLLEEGTRSPRLVVLLEGRVAILKRDRGGVEHPIAACGPGQVIGELGLLLRQPRSATVRALEPLRAFVMDPEQYDGMLAGGDLAAYKTALALARTLGQRISAQNARMVDLLEEIADHRKRAELERVHDELQWRWDF